MDEADFGNPICWQILYSDNCLSLDYLSSFATAHMCVGIDRSELSTYALQLAYCKAVIIECCHVRLLLGAASEGLYMIFLRALKNVLEKYSSVAEQACHTFHVLKDSNLASWSLA